jgi:hypothetical protein
MISSFRFPPLVHQLLLLRLPDETKLTSAVNSVSNITIAKKMVFELPGFTDLTGTV